MQPLPWIWCPASAAEKPLVHANANAVDSLKALAFEKIRDLPGSANACCLCGTRQTWGFRVKKGSKGAKLYMLSMLGSNMSGVSGMPDMAGMLRMAETSGQ